MNQKSHEGYVALMAAVIICLILIVLSVTISASGFYTRFDILDAQAKFQSNALAESCVNVAMSRLTQNPSYPYPSTESVNLGTDNCKINGITGSGTLKTITTNATYLKTYTNLAVNATINSATIIQSLASVLVRVIVNNTHGGTKQASDFSVSVSASGATPGLFSGDSTGVAVSMNPGSYSVGISSSIPSNYGAPAGDSGCSNSSIPGGGSAVCTITINDLPTTATLTVVAKVINDNGGSKQPSDFTLKIDGTTQASGSPRSGLSIGNHTVTAASFTGYSVSAWDSGCPGGVVALAAGNSKTCTVVYDDNPPPSPVCADTVMMLDRTTGFFDSSGAPTDEQSAAEGLLDLYKTVTPNPLVGVGSFGGTDNTSQALVPPTPNFAPAPASGWLTNSYGTSTPTSGTSGPNFPKANGAGSWTSPSNAQANDTSFATSATLNQQQAWKTFGLSVPTGATVTGIEATVDAKSSATAVNSANLAPNGVGDYNNWTGNPTNTTSGRINDVQSNDNDSTYISESTQGDAQTYNFANANVPTGSTVNSVTLFVLARASSGSPNLVFREETSTSSSQRRDSAATSTLPGSYTLLSNTWTTNATGGSWSVNEVNNWSTSFGVIKNNSSGTARVTQAYLVVNYTPPSGSLGVSLSWNNGGAWSTAKTDTLSGTEAAPTLGNSTDTWGRAWASTDFSDSNFGLRLTNNAATGTTVSVDYVTIKVYYTIPASGLYALINYIDNGSSSVGTHLDTAVNVAAAELNSSRHISGNPKVMILVTDGVPNPDSSNIETNFITVANTAKANGVSIFILHFGDPASEDLTQVVSPSTLGNSSIGTNGAKRSGTTVTITTSAAHNLSPNQTVKISGVSNNAFNGTFVVTSVPSSTTFTYKTSGSGTLTSNNGTVTPTNLFDAPASSQMLTIFQTIGKQVCPAVGATAPPPPTTANLIVVTHVSNTNGGILVSGNFTVNVTGTNVSKPTFNGADTPGVTVTMSPGAFGVTEGVISGYSESADSGCGGSILAGVTQTCVLTNSDLPTPPPPAPPVPTPPVVIINTWQETP